MTSINNKLVNNIIKPVSTAKLGDLTTMAAATGAFVATVNNNDDNNNYIRRSNSNPSSIPANEKKINLVEFSRLYRIGQIPIIDFIVVYIILYIVNALCWNFDFKFILVATIPITILFNIFSNKQLKISWVIIVILIICFYLLLTMDNIGSKQ